MDELCERVIEVRDILWSRRKLIICTVLIGALVGLLLSATLPPKTIVMVEIDPPQSGASDIRSELSAMGLHAVQWPNGQLSVDLSYTPEDRQIAVDRRSMIEAYINETGLKARVIERSPSARLSLLSVALPAFLGFLLSACYAVAVGTFLRRG